MPREPRPGPGKYGGGRRGDQSIGESPALRSPRSIWVRSAWVRLVWQRIVRGAANTKNKITSRRLPLLACMERHLGLHVRSEDWETTDASRSEMCGQRRMSHVAWGFPESSQQVERGRGHSSYNGRLRCSSAERFAPASSSKPVRKAQNIRLTDSAKGPET